MLLNGPKVNPQPLGPVLLLLGHLYYSNNNRVFWVAGISGYDQRGGLPRACPLFDEVEFVAGEDSPALDDGDLGVIFEESDEQLLVCIQLISWAWKLT